MRVRKHCRRVTRKRTLDEVSRGTLEWEREQIAPEPNHETRPNRVTKMGAFYSASCLCGYRAHQLLDGVGFAAVPYSPALCRTCGEVLSIRLDRKRLRCPHCRRKPEIMSVVEFDSDDRSRPVTLYMCPKCGGKTLRLEPEGLWD